MTQVEKKFSPTILVVDDNEDNRDILERYLKREGHPVLLASDGAESLEILHSDQGKTIGVILLDRMMPRMNGVQVLKQVRMSEPTIANIPIIFVTAMAMEHDILSGLALGAHAYICKPFKKPELLGKVNSALIRYKQQQELLVHLEKATGIPEWLDEGVCYLKTILAGGEIADYLSHMCAQRDAAAMSLSILLENSITHGNLDIDYEMTTALICEGMLSTEINRRLSMTHYGDKKVKINFKRDGKDIVFEIIDEGGGFDWRQYLSIRPGHSEDNHGRDIALAYHLSHQTLTYSDEGKRAIVRFRAK